MGDEPDQAVERESSVSDDDTGGAPLADTAAVPGQIKTCYDGNTTHTPGLN